MCQDEYLSRCKSLEIIFVGVPPTGRFSDYTDAGTFNGVYTRDTTLMYFVCGRVGWKGQNLVSFTFCFITSEYKKGENQGKECHVRTMMYNESCEHNALVV